MAMLMQIRNTMFDHTFTENAADINRVMVLGCQLVAEATPGEDSTNGVILELGHIHPAGTHSPAVHNFTNTGLMTSTATTAIHEDEWSSESMAY